MGGLLGPGEHGTMPGVNAVEIPDRNESSGAALPERSCAIDTSWLDHGGFYYTGSRSAKRTLPRREARRNDGTPP